MAAGPPQIGVNDFGPPPGLLVNARSEGFHHIWAVANVAGFKVYSTFKFDLPRWLLRRARKHGECLGYWFDRKENVFRC
ncbi:MAG: hypothetical protein A3E01_18555 [Gammaproteobacteria bacterium RIFCSPHIGHO2_12_FULL_63_22]|nr:MAG: hypothetical protein A3E01_18555 [Gammaproteobacteria bacterium RIFCSPHIGHO2_12_FULL_63_22]